MQTLRTLDTIQNKLKAVSIVPIQFVGALNVIMLIDNYDLSLPTKSSQYVLETNNPVSDNIQVGLKTIRLNGFIAKETISFSKQILESAVRTSLKANNLINLIKFQISGIQDLYDSVKVQNGVLPFLQSTESVLIYNLYQNWLLFKNETGRVAQFLISLIESKSLVNVQTPFGYFSNMVLSLESIVSNVANGDTAEARLVLTEFPRRQNLQIQNINPQTFARNFKSYEGSQDGVASSVRGVDNAQTKTQAAQFVDTFRNQLRSLF